MLKKALFLGVFLAIACYANAQETITITTYYPSPSGSYSELTAFRMKIGQTYSANAVAVGNNNLIVEGRIGIGTTAPGQMLELRRNNANSVIRFLDPGDYWYSMGIDRADNGSFKINYGSDVGTSDMLTMTAGGRVGLGTRTPRATLDVIGDITVNDELVFCH